MMTNLLSIIALLWSSGQCRGARRRSSNNVQRTEQWPANRYAAGTEAECPPSCPTRDLRDARPAARGALTADQHYTFHERGFLVLPGLFSAAEVDALSATIDSVWRGRRIGRAAARIVADWFVSTPRETRGVLREAPDTATAHPLKLNDLYLDVPAVRGIALDARLSRVLSELLDSRPVLINTLSMNYGTQQKYHFDTFYMPPPTTNKMVAAWIALDDVGPENGPLRYVPGSHRIRPYRFSTGKLNVVKNEMRNFSAYIQAELKKHELHPAEFRAKKGDVLIWHAQLYHRGARIRDELNRTRRSLVAHYFSTIDFPSDGAHVRRHDAGGLYYARPRLDLRRQWRRRRRRR